MEVMLIEEMIIMVILEGFDIFNISKSLCLYEFCTALYRRDQAVATYF